GVDHRFSRLWDFYRGMAEVFSVPLHPHNRWGGFKILRQRFVTHVDNLMMRPVLLVDEAQELLPSVLAELRLLAATQFDSRTVLSVVFAGDARLTDRPRQDELLPLRSPSMMRRPMAYAGGHRWGSRPTKLPDS